MILKSKIKKYLALSKINIQRALTYRISFLTSLLAALIQLLVMFYIWKAAFSEKITIVGFTYSDMLTYLFVSQGINNIYGWYTTAERNIAYKIRTGDIALDLVKPLRFNLARFFEVLGVSFVQVFFIIIIFTIFKILIPEFRAPQSVLYLFLFLVSTFLGFLCMFSLSFLVGLVSFWTLNYWGLYYVKKSIFDFFSGAIIPLQFLPLSIQKITVILPFKSIVFTPTLIYLGKFTIYESIFQILFQAFWVVALWISAVLMFNLAIKKVVVHGG